MILKAILCLLLYRCVDSLDPQRVEDMSFWWNSEEAKLLSQVKQRAIESVARNTIVFVANGYGINTVTAARIYKGQAAGHSGEEAELAIDKFGHVGAAKVYSIDRQAANEFSAGKAVLGGAKEPNMPANCNTADRTLHSVEQLVREAAKARKHVGLVTTGNLLYGSVAASYTNSPNLYSTPEKFQGKCCNDGEGILKNADVFNVIFSSSSVPNVTKDMCWNASAFATKWISTMKATKKPYSYIKNVGDINRLSTDYVLGLFDHNLADMSLKELTVKAIGLLNRSRNGFLLLIEHPFVEFAHRKSRANLALTEMLSLDEAVGAAFDATDTMDTLIIVTSGYGDVMMQAGYPPRGNPISAIVDVKDRDGVAFTSMSYADGPMGHPLSRTSRPEPPAYAVLQQPNHQFQALVSTDQSSSGASDTPIYASGPWAHLIHSTHEHSYIAYVIMHAACLSDIQLDDHCKQLHSIPSTKARHVTSSPEPSPNAKIPVSIAHLLSTHIVSPILILTLTWTWWLGTTVD